MNKRGHGEGSIGKRKDGIFYGTVQLDSKRHWVYGETRKEVADKLKAIRQKHEQGINFDAERTTVELFLCRWLEDVVKLRNKPSTYDSYRQIVNTHIIPNLGTHTLADLRPDHVQAWVNKLSQSKKAPRTIRNARAVLRKALNQAVRWRYISLNVATLVELPRMEQYKIQPLTLAEARRFLKAIKGHRLEALYIMTLLLGLREGEVLGVLISNLDLDKGMVTIDGALQWQNGKLVRATTKTTGSVRTLYLPPTLIPMLTEHIARQQAQFPDNPYLFATVKGTPINPRNLVRQFKALLVDAKLRDIRFHDLRHSCATFLIASGAHPRTIMEILGHTQISTTLNIYGHVPQETQAIAVQGVDRLLFEV